MTKRLLALALAVVTMSVTAQVTNPPTWNPPQPPIFIGSPGQVLEVQAGGTTLGFSNAPLPGVSIASSTILCNATASAAPPAACNPLAVAILMNADIGATLVGISNVASLSGNQTVDGTTTAPGNVILLTQQSTASQNGLWIAQAGAWTRPVNFPSGFVIPTACIINVILTNGATKQGATYTLQTGVTITIDTTAQVWSQIAPLAATATRAGVNTVTDIGGRPSVVMNGTATGNPDCASFFDAAGTIQDVGDANSQKGDCALTNSATGHLIINNGGFHPTASAGTLNTNATDHWGVVTGLSTATTLTITFSSAWPNNVVSCTAATSASGNAVGVTYTSVSSTITAAVFAFASLTGSLSYLCFGTN